MKFGKYAVLVLLTCLCLATLAGALLTKRHYHKHEGEVVAMSFLEYYNGTLHANDTTVSWGNDLVAGNSYTQSYRVHNTGTVQAKVQLFITNLPSGYTLTWTGNNTVLNAGEDVTAPMTLMIPANAVGPFSFDAETVLSEV